MKKNIITPMPLTKDEISERYERRCNEKADVWIDFSSEEIGKALFLDIDGVLQPYTQYRFDYVRDENVMEELYKKLEAEFGINYREFNKYDVAATYYDWDKGAVAQLKRILDITDAKIVLSSNWRTGIMADYMPFLMRIHDLQKYLYGYTPDFYEGKIPKYKGVYEPRVIEIWEYLKAHPHIKKWVAVDDMDMSKEIPDNFVRTCPKITEADADKCIEILGASTAATKHST